jgi:hypothetical protein
MSAKWTLSGKFHAQTTKNMKILCELFGVAGLF